jgi:ketosteroid isomerase-like protein
VKAASTTSPNTRRRLERLVELWHGALLRRDTDTLAHICADDYIAVNPAGEITTKAQDIEAARTQDLRLETFQADQVEVREFGEVAVVTSRTTFKGKYYDVAIDGRFRNMFVFVRRARRWQAVAAQSTRIDEEQR